MFLFVLSRPAGARVLSADRVQARTRLATLPQLRHWLLWSGGLAALTVILGFAVTSLHQVAAAEVVVDEELSRRHDIVLTAIALTIDTVFSPKGIVVILALLFVFLLVVSRSPVNAVAVTLLVTAGWLSSEVFKLIVSRTRLSTSLLAHPLLSESGTDSYPSGHTSFAVALAIALYLLARHTRWSRLAPWVAAFFVVVVGASRLYLGVHYPSDILGAVLGSTAAVIFVAGMWNRYGLRALNRIPILARFGPIPVSPPSSR